MGPGSYHHAAFHAWLVETLDLQSWHQIVRIKTEPHDKQHSWLAKEQLLPRISLQSLCFYRVGPGC